MQILYLYINKRSIINIWNSCRVISYCTTLFYTKKKRKIKGTKIADERIAMLREIIIIIRGSTACHLLPNEKISMYKIVYEKY